MGNKHRYGQEDWGYSDFQAQRNEREQAKANKRMRTATRKRKKMEDVTDV